MADRIYSRGLCEDSLGAGTPNFNFAILTTSCIERYVGHASGSKVRQTVESRVQISVDCVLLKVEIQKECDECYN